MIDTPEEAAAGGGTGECKAVENVEMAIGEDSDDTFSGILDRGLVRRGAEVAEEEAMGRDSNSEGNIGTAGQAV